MFREIENFLYSPETIFIFLFLNPFVSYVFFYPPLIKIDFNVSFVALIGTSMRAQHEIPLKDITWFEPIRFGVIFPYPATTVAMKTGYNHAFIHSIVLNLPHL